MSPSRSLWTTFRADRKGVTAMEYGVIAGVLALTIASTFSTLTGKLVNAFNALSF